MIKKGEGVWEIAETNCNGRSVSNRSQISIA